ncbi:flagellar biosynthesis anti-sigma factor FlgM [bacterium]|nr:flagellar biosynthesis anti-sigma factor FlgM [bacterium]
MKISGSKPYLPIENKKSNNKIGKQSFDKNLEKASKPELKDSVKLGSNPAPVSNSYTNLSLLSANKSDASASVEAVTKRVLNSSDEVNAKVQEIKSLIDEGGAQAYFDTVDSEKVAQKLLKSGSFDDLI